METSASEPNTIKIDPETKAAWVAELRKPEIRQVTGHLYAERDDGLMGYCCLGVLAKVKGCNLYFAEIEPAYEGDLEMGEPAQPAELANEATVDWNGDDINTSEMLRYDFAQPVGLYQMHQDFLASLNDGSPEIIPDGHMLKPLYEKYALSGTPGPAVMTTKYKLRKHTFAEIADIIEQEF